MEGTKKKSVLLKEQIYQLNAEKVQAIKEYNDKIATLEKEILAARVEERDYYHIRSLHHYSNRVSKITLLCKNDNGDYYVLPLRVQDANESLFVYDGFIYYYGENIAVLKARDDDDFHYILRRDICYGNDIPEEERDHIEDIYVVGYLELSI